ncbi:nuclear transport factor 2 family protein [Chryseosolibacter indicus]|uniref:DUF4440 domain-containing protein n=1 Tax=Chryseosolibacter indicus TaxID=2782351 RepID=A0ABS5VSF8_9BACT|nr:nuclear transport factor 2 family protein [Chryseosolibacter indicus]MBT1704286.1 DUF4440 domain-containing protein [Chryseosolibacter indicus]
MKYLLATSFLFFISCFSFAQHTSDKRLQSLVNAELAFSNLAKEKNTREAFLTFLSDSAITFGPGIRKGKKPYQDQKPNDAWLYWYPVYSDISASRDFGFNTGPWEFRPRKTDEKAVAFGHFVTMWQKQNDGKWKALIDIGISHAQLPEKPAWKTSTITLKKNSSAGLTKQEMIEIESTFIKSLTTEGHTAYNTVLSSEARLYRDGNIPFTSPAEITQYLTNQTTVPIYEAIDGAVAPSGDLAYVYGTAEVEVTKEGSTEKKQAYYMRIWKRENTNWKVVLDILTL